MGCRTVRPKKELVRVVRSPEGSVLVDPSGKKSGRGAYTCPNLNCLELAFKGSLLDNALETSITAQMKEQLKSDLSKLIK
ncbi:MAG TPA: YlxR family protein [Bacillota bacterium]|nr:YlxR family protein [Bacillota bacterium]